MPSPEAYVAVEIINPIIKTVQCSECGIGTCTHVEGQSTRTFQPDAIGTDTHRPLQIMSSIDACPWNKDLPEDEQIKQFLRWLELTGLARHAAVFKYMLDPSNLAPVSVSPAQSRPPIVTEYQPPEPFPIQANHCIGDTEDIRLQEILMRICDVLPISEIFYPEKVGSNGVLKATILPQYKQYFPHLASRRFEIEIALLTDPDDLYTLGSIKNGEFILDISDGNEEGYFIAQLVFQLFILSDRNEKLLQALPYTALKSYKRFKNGSGLFNAIECLVEAKTITTQHYAVV